MNKTGKMVIAGVLTAVVLGIAIAMYCSLAEIKAERYAAIGELYDTTSNVQLKTAIKKAAEKGYLNSLDTKMFFKMQQENKKKEILEKIISDKTAATAQPTQ